MHSVRERDGTGRSDRGAVTNNGGGEGRESFTNLDQPH